MLGSRYFHIVRRPGTFRLLVPTLIARIPDSIAATAIVVLVPVGDRLILHRGHRGRGVRHRHCDIGAAHWPGAASQMRDVRPMLVYLLAIKPRNDLLSTGQLPSSVSSRCSRQPSTASSVAAIEMSRSPLS